MRTSSEIDVARDAAFAGAVEQAKEMALLSYRGTPADENNQAGMSTLASQRKEVVTVAGNRHPFRGDGVGEYLFIGARD
jgi:hypothetical protein